MSPFINYYLEQMKNNLLLFFNPEQSRTRTKKEQKYNLPIGGLGSGAGPLLCMIMLRRCNNKKFVGDSSLLLFAVAATPYVQ